MEDKPFRLTKEAQDMSDEAVDSLIGAIIKQALRDYTRDLDSLKRRMKNPANSKEEAMQKHFLEEKSRDKAVAEIFFKKSELFKLTGLDADWLIKEKIRLKKLGIEDEDDDLDEDERKFLKRINSNDTKNDSDASGRD